MTHVIRWVIFLPLAVLLISLAQIITGTIATHLPWWISIPVVLCFGVVLTIAGNLPVNIAPNRKIGVIILLALFSVLEIISLSDVFHEYTALRLLVRIYTDLAIITGALVAAIRTDTQS